MDTTTLKPIVPSEMSPPLAPVLIADFAGLALVADYLKRTDVSGLDLETNVVENFVDRKIRTIQFGDKQEQYVIDLLLLAGSTEALVSAQGDFGVRARTVFAELIDTIRPFLEDPKKIKVGQNLNFEYETLRYCLGIRTDGFFDIQKAEQNTYAGLVRFTEKGFWGMEHLVARHCGLQIIADLSKSFDLSSPLTQAQLEYASLDVRLPMAVRNSQLRVLASAGITRPVEIDCCAIPAFGDMHLNGMLCGNSRWRSLIERNLSRKKAIIAKMDTFFMRVVGSKNVTEADRAAVEKAEFDWKWAPSKSKEEKDERARLRAIFYKLRKANAEKDKLREKCEGDAAINYGSGPQLLKALRHLGYSEKVLPDTSDPTLEKVAKLPNLDVEVAFKGENPSLDYGVIDLLRLFRSVDKLLSTYGEAWVSEQGSGGHVNPKTGRIHSNINLLGADTGRTTSSSPNVQNLPKLPIYRNAFVARPGFKILTIDFNGCELRILAEMSGEKVWLDAFAKGWDVHSVGAEIIFGQEWIDAAEPGCQYVSEHQKCKCKGHKDLRDRIKAINFGLAYGMAAKKLSDQLGITEEEAAQLLERYKAAFPTVMKFLDELGEMAKEQLQSRTMSGRRRRWHKPTKEKARILALKQCEEDKKQFQNWMVSSKLRSMGNSIEREGKNCPIQGTNADMAKLAGYYIWLELEPRFGAYFYNFVHDEWVIECPEETAEECFKFVSECMSRAGAEFVKSIEMTTEGHIGDCWTK